MRDFLTTHTSDVNDMILLSEKHLSALPNRPGDGHKGTFGRVLIVGGSPGMSGAAFLAAKAAYRAGCGLVEILCPEENRIIHQIQLPEAIVTCYTKENAAECLKSTISRADAVGIGMGLSCSETAALLVKIGLTDFKKTLILDADGLNLVSANDALFCLLRDRKAETIVTPHLGEMSRLTKQSVSEIAANTAEYGRKFAADTGAITVLKSAKTVVCDGQYTYLNTFGNDGMATGGSGDVLAGVITSLAAQGADASTAARLGVLIHALAGDAAARDLGRRGVMAGDIAERVGKVINLQSC